MENHKFQIVSCSGASNTGKYADEVARRLSVEGAARMLCLARFSIDKPFAVESKEGLDHLVVLDGCAVNCAQKTILESGVTSFQHVHITDFGIVKGKTPFIPEKASEMIEHIKTLAH
jgi:uncharacterized metal-binding protein